MPWAAPTRIDSDAGATDYGYDPLGRLTQAAPDQALQAKGLPQEQYGYDAVGNRTSSAHQAGAWSYNADNQLIQYPKTTPFSATPAVDTQVSYTPQGHTKEETNAQGTRTFSYNAAERLSELSQGSTTVRYRYDPFGRRISKSVTQGGSTQTTYFLNGDSALMAEADGNGQITRAYGFNPSTQSDEQDLWSTDPLWQAELGGKSSLSDAAFHYVATDHLGTPILATDKQGNKSWRGHSEAFGNTGADSGSAIQMNLRFPGQYYDRETNLHQNWFRDYNPGVGRYAQGDPLGLEAGMNAFAYSYNNPLSNIDPSGEIPIAPILWGFTRCVSGCMARSALEEAFLGDIDCFSPTNAVKDCAIDCLNPLGWFGKSANYARRPGLKKPSYWRKLYEQIENKPWPRTPDGRNYHAHHRWPLADGGADIYENIEPMHPDLHGPHHRENRIRWGKRPRK